MRNKLILQAFVPAALLALLIAAFPSGLVGAEGCVDENGRPMTCPQGPKKRPTVVYPTFTPTVTNTPVPTATKVPTSTLTLVSASSATASKDTGAGDLPGETGSFLWPGVLLGGVGVLFVVWLMGGGGSSTFTAEAYGDLNADTEHETLELHGDVSGDDSPDSQDGMFEKKEDE